ncbi:MAG: hypothetical protein M3O34_09520 [Chloroflexota bacterium]|nr:hypothetical protein [Chloroflexota bacterium]
MTLADSHPAPAAATRPGSAFAGARGWAAHARATAGDGAIELSARAMFVLLGAIALAALVIQGGVFFQKTWLWTGDTIYHRALMAEIQAGELLPGGPYAGLPAFYSPLFHYLAAAIGSAARIELTEAIRVISILFAPLTPLAAFWLARVLGLDHTSALVGAFFSTFAGGLRQSEDRVWVDALFVGPHNFFPVFPRDIAFLLLPLGLGLVYRAVVQGWRPGAPLAGLAFGLMILAHTQTAVFAAPLLAIYLGIVVLLRRDLFWPAVRVSVVTCLVTLTVSAFWWTWQLWAILRSGSFGVEMPAYRVPVTVELHEFPAEFGVFLLLGPLGIWLVARRFWRDRDLAMLLLLIWFWVPVLLAIFRPTGFPGGDTFFPRRLWQFGSQPLVLMAGLALVAGIVRPLRLRGPLAAALVAIIGLIAAVPASIGTAQRVNEFWNEPSFGDQVWDLAGNFGIGPYLAAEARAHGPRTVMAPTPEATLVWYYAGQKVVYLHPTAAIKLAFDVERMTGHGEAERKTDLVAAYAGDPRELARLAEKYDARYVVMKRHGDRLGGVDLPAHALQQDGDARGKGDGRLTDTNHYQYLALNADDRVQFQVWSPTDRAANVVLRTKRRNARGASLGTLSVNGQATTIADSELPRDTWADVRRDVPLRAGWNVVQLESAAQLEVIRFSAFTLDPADLPPEWRLAYDDGWYVVFQTREDGGNG